VRDQIMAAIEAAIADLAAEVEVEPAGDPIDFPALGITDGGHSVLEHEVTITRRSMMVTIDGFVEGGNGRAPTAERNALWATVVTALLNDETLGALIEVIDDGDYRPVTATLANVRRLGFTQDFEIQFSTSRADPALPA
jgi:hypothetical protein